VNASSRSLKIPRVKNSLPAWNNFPSLVSTARSWWHSCWHAWTMATLCSPVCLRRTRPSHRCSATSTLLRGWCTAFGRGTTSRMPSQPYSSSVSAVSTCKNSPFRSVQSGGATGCCRYFRDRCDPPSTSWIWTCMKAKSRRFSATTAPGKRQPCSCWQVRSEPLTRHASTLFSTMIIIHCESKKQEPSWQLLALVTSI